MRRGARFGLQGLLLLALLPVLVLITLALAIIAYRELHATIIAGFDAKLTAVSTVTAGLVDKDMHHALLQAVRDARPGEEIEASEDFQAAVAPLRRIKEKLGLTYLYTQAPVEGIDIVYVLDANIDDNHSPPGTVDSLPEDDASNILSVLETGTPHITGIQQWEQWGLIKTAFAPLPSAAGPDARTGRKAEAMAGADVDISVINRKLRDALVSVGLVGAAALLLSLGIALLVARRLAGPLAGIKLAGFRLAAGETAVEVPSRGARELATLADAFNRMSRSLREEMVRAEAADRHTEWERRTSGLQRLLERRSDGTLATGITASPAGTGGGVKVGNIRVGWLLPADLADDVLAARARSLQLAYLATTGDPQPGALLARLSPLLGPGLPLLLALEGDLLSLRTLVPLIGPDGTILPAGEHELVVSGPVRLSGTDGISSLALDVPAMTIAGEAGR